MRWLLYIVIKLSWTDGTTPTGRPSPKQTTADPERTPKRRIMWMLQRPVDHYPDRTQAKRRLSQADDLSPETHPWWHPYNAPEGYQLGAPLPPTSSGTRQRPPTDRFSQQFRLPTPQLPSSLNSPSYRQFLFTTNTKNHLFPSDLSLPFNFSIFRPT